MAGHIDRRVGPLAIGRLGRTAERRPVDGDHPPETAGDSVSLADRLLAALRAVTGWQWALVALIGAYTWYFTAVTYDVHRGLGTSAYDSGLYDQGVWLLSRFHAPFVTLMGRNLFGDHTSFILVGLVPVYWVFPSTSVLFAAQALAIGLGALPVFLLARRLLGRESYAVGFAVCYLLHPAVSWTNRENFHPDAFLAPFVGFAIYGAIERRWRVYVVFTVLALLVKEDVSLVLVPLGAWVAIKRDRRIGILTIVGCITFMLAAMFLVMRSLIGVPTRNTWRIPFGGPRGFLRAALTDPVRVARFYWSDSRPFYLWQMAVPSAGAVLRSPGVAAISLLVVATNMLSTFHYQYEIEYHYSLVAVPAIVLGTVYAVSRLRATWRPVAMVVLLAVGTWSAWAWGALPFSRDVPASWAPSDPVPAAARDILRDVPPGAVVSAQYSLSAQLTHRREIYMFPNPFSVELYGPDDSQVGRRLPAADRVEYVVLPATMEERMTAIWDRVAPEFELVRANEWWRLYHRRGG